MKRMTILFGLLAVLPLLSCQRKKAPTVSEVSVVQNAPLSLEIEAAIGGTDVQAGVYYSHKSARPNATNADSQEAEVVEGRLHLVLEGLQGGKLYNVVVYAVNELGEATSDPVACKVDFTSVQAGDNPYPQPK